MAPESMDPNIVGNAFVLEYYNRLYESPSEAQRFYFEGSTIGRPGPDGDMVYAKSLKEINDQIMSVDYNKSKIQILAADSQKSLNNGVVTLVTGLVATKHGEKTQFSQSFFLVPKDGSYYVLNDSLVYVSDNFGEPKPTTEDAQVIVESVSEPETVQLVAIPSEAEATVPAPVANGHAEVPKEVVVDRNSNLPKPRTFADIVHSLAQNGGQFNAKVSPAKPKHVEKPKAAPAPTASAPTASAPIPQRPSAETIAKPGPGRSIFVARLAMYTTPERLFETFKGFGAIRKNGIQVRSYEEDRNCFGFVEFESEETAKIVLQAQKESPIIIGDRIVSVEAKRADRNGGRPHQRNNNYYKNDDGYRNNNYYKNDDGNRNNGYRPRGNGFTGRRGNGVERQNGDYAKASQRNGNGNAHAGN